MSVTTEQDPRRARLAMVAIVGGLFVLTVAVAMFVFLYLLHPPPGGWGAGFFVLIADIALLGVSMLANGRFMMRHGRASGLLQGFTFAMVAAFAVTAMTTHLQ